MITIFVDNREFISLFTKAFATFLITIGPINATILFMGLTGDEYTTKEKHSMALQANFISGIIIVSLIFFGSSLLKYLGIDFFAVQISGGLLLLLVSIQTVFNKDHENQELSDEFSETISKAKKIRPNLSVFPLAIPMIAGPGAISSSIAFTGEAHGIFSLKLAIALAAIVTIIISLVFMLSSKFIETLTSKSVRDAMSRIIGLILAALSVQFIIEGIKNAIFTYYS